MLFFVTQRIKKNKLVTHAQQKSNSTIVTKTIFLL